MKEKPPCEDRVILSLLGVERPEEAAAPPPEGENAETLHRLYTEVLGLLATEPDPVAPRPETRERLLAALRGEAPPAGVMHSAGVLPFPARQEAPAPASAEDPESVDELTQPARPRPVWWPWLAAACLALAGVAGLWVQSRQDVAAASAEVATLERELAAGRERERAASERLAGVENDLATLGSKLGMVTRTGAVVCPLRPAWSGAAGARGAVYIAADHQHWFLRAVGLPALPPGHTYQLWFLTAEGPVSGGTFHAAAGADAELGSPTMPSGIVGFAVTLEPAAGVTQPTGPRVLAGSEPVEIL